MSSCWPRTLHTPSSEESRNVRVWAWWDFKSCAVPGGFDAAKVAPAIMEAVRANGIKGPLSITAFGDVLQLPRYRQEALAYTGVRFTHVSNDERNSADIIVDLMYWVSQNPPPAHLFLISGDRDFAGILHRLRMSNYNILLATPERTPSVLCGAATIAWHWPSLLKGENLTGKHFNYPPDGPSGSWYGSCMVSQLEKPPAPCLPNVEVYEPSSGSVPKSLVRQIRHILSMHPKGIGITELRAELAKCDVHYCVHLVSSESAESFESSSVASNVSGVGNGDRGRAAAVKPNGDDKNSKTKMDSLQMTSQKSDNDIVKSEDASHKSHVCQPPNELQKSSVANAQQSKTQQPPKDNKDSKTKMDSLQMTSQKSDNDIVKSEDASHKIDDSIVVQRPGGSAETNSRSPTFFSWFRSWWPFGKNNAKYDNLTAHQNKVVIRMLVILRIPSYLNWTRLASFWNEMESFIFAPKASLLFSQSRSREDVVHRLQSGGPLVLRSLPKKDILHLVELLIIEKKWLEESPSRIFPFKLTQPVQKNSLMDQSHGANVTETIYIKRSRYDILGDCQKLVSEILREHPEGYNIGCFRRLFVDRYGYHLDIKKLGYQKLAALLQIMPGVKLESTYIFPSVTTVCDSDSETSTLKTQATTDSHAASNSDSELSESALKHANNESSWDELGPVSFNKSNMSDLEIKSKEQRKPKCNEQNSSFWQAMDLWHSNKEGENNNVESLDVSLADIFNSSTESTSSTLSKIPSPNKGEKQRSEKKYSFVADPVLPNKDKLVDGFKKTDESNMQN
uniref:HTH OST-type domain-containing protein n=1 Tax=Cajanus cajan TaxID=3821 RepID=A0A151TE63_CAJCA|nr:hypothetical protein KK1_011550 [Cajanus cajan]